MDAMQRNFQIQQNNVFRPKLSINYTTLGNTCESPTNVQTHDFSGTYRSRLETTWCPSRTSRPDPPLLLQSSELYHKGLGMLPGYGGHVPGDVERYGRSYGSHTKDPKRYIRGDFQ